MAPFLIEDLTPRTERIPQNFDHKNGVAGIERVTVAVGELATVEKWYGALLGSSGQKIVADDLGAEGLAFHAGPHIFEFLMPRDAASPLVNWLRQFGPSPFSAVLKASGAESKLLGQRAHSWRPVSRRIANNEIQFANTWRLERVSLRHPEDHGGKRASLSSRTIGCCSCGILSMRVVHSHRWRLKNINNWRTAATLGRWVLG